jgi:hypothetical protein
VLHQTQARSGVVDVAQRSDGDGEDRIEGTERVLDFGRETMTKAEFDDVVGLFRLLHELHERMTG